MTSINCVWFCLLLCHSCNIFGLLRLEQHLVEALPFEYLEEHEDDFNYDLDEAQSQAKYDARLLSEQMLSDAELQQRADIESGISSYNTNVDGNVDANSNSGNIKANSESESDNRAQSAAGFVDSSAAEDDLEPHSRAAACFTNGHKYTHGQKVPRLDACEVCLCMDGEIFCWWEKCDKASANSAGATATATGGDYSDPYRHETTTRKSTKLHKTERKVGKRHKHHKNQKNFNDYEVYHSRQQAADYKKPDIKQQKQKNSDGSPSSSTNYNIIKQHKHEQQQLKLATSTSQQQQQEQQLPKPQQQQQLHVVAVTAVNQASKDAHYQHQLPTPQQQQQQQQHEQPAHQQHEQQQHLHTHQPHSSSKILNFPENLPALLYYDYKTEEHEHHQHQHHQQHLLHEKQRLQQQQQQRLQQQQQQQQQQQHQLQKANRDVELDRERDLGNDKNFDEAETDSDILPEPPTKRPTKPTTTTDTSTMSSINSISSSSNIHSSNGKATTIAVATTIEMMTTPRSEHAATVVAMMASTNEEQVQHGAEEIEDTDDAFHRWLTSTELNVDSTNTLDDNLPAVVVEQETPASTIIDDVGVNSSSSSSSSGNSSSIAVNPKDNANKHGNNIADNADAVFFRSSYNDYSSEFNGSVVNIDITLTAVDVHPQRPHQQQKHQQRLQQQPKATAANGQTDLIANDNQTSDVNVAERQPTMVPTAATTAAAAATTSTAATTTTTTVINSNNHHSVPPYTLTTIITTTPLATGRMCNVLGKLYKIGEILPQDTGNCLQCICTDAVTPDELPSVTCSPHNCPPLVLPDLFDATGY